MNILVLFGEIAFISRDEKLNGIVDEAKKDGNSVFLFTCEGFAFHHLKQYSAGEYEIYTLPHFENYDGVIVDFNSIHNQEMIDYIKDNIKRTNIPCVSFGYSIPNGIRIDSDYENAFADMVEHLVTEHGYQTFKMLTGHTLDRESIRRKEIFEKVMKKYRIDISQEDIVFGDFNITSGKKLANDLATSNQKLPDAIVCANDFMAIGLIEGLGEHGIHCPEDIAITGFDNTLLGQTINKSLSTIDLNEYQSGAIAYHSVLDLCNGKACNDNIIVEGKRIIGQSCGCEMVDVQELSSNTYLRNAAQFDSSLDLIKALNITFFDVKTLREFENAVTPFISRIGIDYLYYCQCGSRESYYHELELYANGNTVDENRKNYKDYKDYNHIVWCPIAYENGDWSSYPAFDCRDLLPPNRKGKNASYNIVMPVHRGVECLGYVVMGDFNGSLSGRVLQHLVLEFDRAFGNIRTNDITNTIMAAINKKWQYDELTAIYNRSGFYHIMPSFLNRAKEKKSGFFVVFFDLDGLKKINDVHGHKAGDDYLCKMAGLLSEFIDEDSVVARFGGDEFIYVSVGLSEEQCENKIEEIRTHLEQHVSVSIGSVFNYADKMEEINQLIQSADEKMYKNKILRKKML